MKFLLTGGGDFDHFRLVDERFRSCLAAGDTVTVIPYASPEEDYEDILARVDESFGDRGRISFLMEKRAGQLNESQFRNTKALFIEGGNTFDLITAVRDANIETYIKGFGRQSDKTLYADSAGAIILGKSVRTAFLGEDADEDERRLQDYRGLDLLDSWCVHAHYEPSDDDAIMSIVYDEGMPVLALHEESGVFISENHEVEVLTRSPLVIFTAAGKQAIAQSQKVLLSDFF